MGIAALALAGWDIVAYTSGGGEATISNVLVVWAKNHPIVSFAIGVLMGHLFWPQRLEK